MFSKQRMIWLLALVMAALCVCATSASAGTLKLPDATRIIDEEAFYQDTSVGEVILPENIEEIRARAFGGSGLTRINLPGSLTFIDDTIFAQIDEVTVEVTKGTYAYDWACRQANVVMTGQCGDCVRWTLRNGALTVSGSGSMWDAEESPFPTQKVQSVVVENGVTGIGSHAFDGCAALVSVELQGSVNAIGACAFNACDKLNSIQLNGNVHDIASDAFDNHMQNFYIYGEEDSYAEYFADRNDVVFMTNEELENAKQYTYSK